MITVPAKLSDLAGFFLFVFRRWRQDRCAQIAGSLTYTTLLALVPMFVVAAAVLSSAPIFEGVMAQVRTFLLLNLVPEIANRVITVYLVEFVANAARLTWYGTAVVFVIALGLMLLIDRSLNTIWRVHRSRALWRSILGYVVLLVVGPVLIGISVSITTYLMSLSIIGIPREWHSRALRVVPVVMSAAAFFLMFVVIPHRRVPWRHALAGGMVAAALFEAAKELFAVYVRYAPTYNAVYGTFAVVPLFLIWVYLSWSIVLLGAELTASLGYWRAGSWKRERTAGNRFHDAVAVARELARAAPAAVTLVRLHEATGLPVQEVEDIVIQMSEAQLARREGRVGYALARSAGEITFQDLHRATLGPIGGLRPEEWAEVSPAFQRAALEMQAGLERPIAVLAGPPGGVAPLRKARRGRARSARSSR